MHTRLLVRAREWAAGARDGSLLLRGAELRGAEAGLDQAAAKEPTPVPLQTEYVLASRGAATRRQRVLLGGVVGAFVVAVVLAGAAVVQWRSAVANEQTAKARELAAYASQQLTVDPEASILLAREAVDRRELPEAIATLRSAIAESRVREVLDRDPDVSMELAAFSPDGQRALTGGSDGAGRVWRLRPKKRVAVVHNPPADLVALAFAPRGRVLTLGSDGTLRVWRQSNGALLATRTGPFDQRLRPTEEGPLISTASFSGDGKSVAVTTGRGEAAMWSPGRRGLTVLRRPHKLAARVAFAGGVRRVAIAYSDGSTVVWDTTTAAPVATLRAAARASGIPALSRDGASAAAGFADGTVHVWDVAARRELAALRGVDSAVDAVALSDDGSRVLAAGADHTVRVWRVDTAAPVAVLRGHTDRVYSAVFDPTGLSVLTASNDGTTRRWSVPAQNGTLVLKPARNVDWNIAFSPDGRVAASADSAGTVRVRAVAGTETKTLRMPPHRGALAGVALSRDDRHVLVMDGFGGVFLGDLARGDFTVMRTNGYPDSFDVDRSSAAIVTATGGHVLVHELTTGRAPVVSRFGRDASSVAFDADGKRVVVGGERGDVNVYEVGNPTPAVILAVGGGRLTTIIRDVSFSPDGRRVVTADEAGIARVWDLGSRRTVAVFDSLGGREMYDSAFSAGGELVATASLDGVVRVWQVSAQQELARFTVPAGVRHPFHSPRGRPARRIHRRRPRCPRRIRRRRGAPVCVRRMRAAPAAARARPLAGHSGPDRSGA
jgi:WD40 repeat protein